MAEIWEGAWSEMRKVKDADGLGKKGARLMTRAWEGVKQEEATQMTSAGK